MNKGKRVPKTSTKQNRGRGLGRGHVEDLPMQVDNHHLEEQLDVALTSPVEGQHVEEQPNAARTSPMEGHHVEEQPYAPLTSQSDAAHSSVGSTTSIRRGRGKNKNKRLKELTKNGPIDIEFEGQERYPSSDNAGFFPRLIGEVLSDHCDLHHDSWTEVPSEMVPILKNHVKSYFRLDDDNIVHVEGLEFGLSRGYSRTRSNLHLHKYKPHFKDINVEDPAAVTDARAKARAIVPTHLSWEQWSLICDSFETKEWKEKCARNAANRSQLKTNHTAGSCSFINVIHKKTKITGVRPKPLEFYGDTHKKKDGSFVNEVVESLYNEMEARVYLDSTDCTEEEAFTEVLGVSRSGHVRGMGLGVKPIRPKSSRATSASQIDVHEECRKQREELETSYQSLREQMAASQEQMAASQERMHAELAASQEQMATLQERMRAEMQKLLSQFQGHGGRST